MAVLSSTWPHAASRILPLGLMLPPESSFPGSLLLATRKVLLQSLYLLLTNLDWAQRNHEAIHVSKESVVGATRFKLVI